MSKKVAVFLPLALVCVGLLHYAIQRTAPVPGAIGTTLAEEKGKLRRLNSPYGQYYQYISNTLTAKPRILVIVHGSLSEDVPAIDLAGRFIRRWMGTADRENLILIAPAFDKDDYQSYGGYRGLFGRDVGADVFVNTLVDRLVPEVPSLTGAFYLYGHSAGGQFTIRYCVRHPDRIVKAVASAPGRYAFPDPSAPWPYGAGHFERKMKYGNPAYSKYVRIDPDYDGWVRASQLPITIVVGSNDTGEQPKRPGHRGRTRIALAMNWAEDMNTLARYRGKTGRVRVKVIEGIGHNSERLTPHCVSELF